MGISFPRIGFQFKACFCINIHHRRPSSYLALFMWRKWPSFLIGSEDPGYPRSCVKLYQGSVATKNFCRRDIQFAERDAPALAEERLFKCRLICLVLMLAINLKSEVTFQTRKECQGAPCLRGIIWGTEWRGRVPTCFPRPSSPVLRQIPITSRWTGWGQTETWTSIPHSWNLHQNAVTNMCQIAQFFHCDDLIYITCKYCLGISRYSICSFCA